VSHRHVLKEITSILKELKVDCNLESAEHRQTVAKGFAVSFESRSMCKILNMFTRKTTLTPYYDFLQNRLPETLPSDRLQQNLNRARLQLFCESSKHLNIKGLPDFVEVLQD